MKKVIEIKQPAKTNIIIDGDVITLERKGLLNSINVGLNANKTFKIKNINSVQIKKPGLTNGYIQFGILGDGGSRQEGTIGKFPIVRKGCKKCNH